MYFKIGFYGDYMIDNEALFNTFKGLKIRDKNRLATYTVDIIARVIGITLFMFLILILMSFLSFALKPFNITITEVVQYFWKDFTFILAIPLSLPSLIGTFKYFSSHKDKNYRLASIAYFIVLTLFNLGIFLYGTIPLLRLIGA
jgi:hypothetical protein